MHIKLTGSLGAVFMFLVPLVPVKAFPVARLRRVKPVVEVRGNAVQWRSARERNPLSYGQWVRTGARGGADVLFNNGTELSLRANSQIEIIAPPSPSQPLVVRVVGALSEVFVRARGRTEIRTAAGTAAVRGTEYLVRLPDENSTVLTVAEGSVDFYNERGRVLVLANQQSTATTRTAPTPPVAVDASGLVQWTAELAGVPLDWDTQNFVTDARAQRALALRAEGDSAAARAAVSQDPSADALAVQMLLALDDGDVDAARAAFDAAPDGRKNSAAALAVRAMVEVQGDDAAGAEALARRAVAAGPNFSAAHSTLALALVQNSKPREAVEAARRAVALAPNSSMALSALAWAEFFDGHPREAGKYAQRVLDRDPLSALALLVYGRARFTAGDRDEARRAFGQAQAVAPGSSLFNRDLGEAWLQLDNAPRAAESFRRASEAGTPRQRAAALAGLGAALAARGNVAEAETAFQKALALDENNRVARGRYGAFLVERGRLAEADVLLKVRSNSTVPDEPTDGEALIRLSESALYRQDVRLAFDYARRAVEVLPDSAPAHYQLGRVLLEQDRVIQAQSQFRLATVLDPTFAAARYALGVTRQKTERGLLSSSADIFGAAAVGGPGSAQSVQNLQSPGADDRIQAAIQDPTAVRVASRSYGDTQLDARVGENGVRDASVSHLKEWGRRRGVYGINAEHTEADGVRAGADRDFNRFGFVLGRKQDNSASGALLLGDYEVQENGIDNGINANPIIGDRRLEYRLPRLIAGYNWQPSANQSTRFLVQGAKLDSHIRDRIQLLLNQHVQIDSLNAEVRHDRRISDSNRLSAGFSIGARNRDFDTVSPPPIPIFPFLISETKGRFRQQTAYVRDEFDINDKLTLTGEMQVVRLKTERVTNIISPVFPGFVSTPITSETTRGIPLFLLTYRPDTRTNVRFRARRLFASITDFQLLNPNDSFLLTNEELPQPTIIGDTAQSGGRSLELELNHSFRDASYARFALYQQNLVNSDITRTRVGPFPNVTLRGARASYEATLGRDLAYFVRTEFNSAHRASGGFLALVPKFVGSAGLQYLNRQGIFAQGIYAYQSKRYDSSIPTARRDGAGVLNLRVGKRQGLRSEFFVELNNAFNNQYDIVDVLQNRRRVAVGISQRF